MPAREQQSTPVQPGQHPRQFQRTISRVASLHYLLYLPQDYEKDKRHWPLVLFLHGAGERGSDIEKVKMHGPPKLVAEGKDFPFILVSPQCPDGQWWDAQVLAALLDDVKAACRVDQDRVYCTGLSMGGYGTWALAIEHPELFAAIAPICGGGTVGERIRICRIKDVPVWCFHGAKDPVVPIAESQVLVDALKQCGGSVRFTIYPEANHNSWTQTYDNPELYEWMLSQRRR